MSRRASRSRSTEASRSDASDDRAQIVLVAAAVVAVAFLSMTLAYAQLGYDGDREGAGAVEVASLSAIDRSITDSYRAAVRDVATDTDTDYRWADRRDAVARIRAAVEADVDRLERAHAAESRSLTVAFDDAAAREWARESCPDGPGRDFGPCDAVGGVVVQERAGTATPVAAAFRIRIVSPAESTTVTTVARAV